MQPLLIMLHDYFNGLHYGDTDKLRRLFHPEVVLKTPGKRRTLEEWLSDVANRPIPSQQGHPFRYKIVSIEVIKDQAMAKVECPLFDYFYIDYLGFLEENSRWQIVSKMYTDIGSPTQPHTATLC
ncbi:MAG: nuclear transport factor 2 family protein [Hahellaceae bacterium]|nr:nuclear transport factor 2 family protein [Hahellaceae bacterium]MCP5168283.1 nuclear transport factor 2 family protein [Hahellaceae bacterium]